MNKEEKKKIRQFEKQNTRQALLLVKKYLDDYGVISLAGSARRYKAFKRGHDFDIQMITEITSKELLIEKIEALNRAWCYSHKIPLHIIVIGNFVPEYIEKKEVGWGIRINYMIHFTTPIRNLWLWVTIIGQKMTKFLFKKSKKQNESQYN